jgi:hypothetical protein
VRFVLSQSKVPAAVWVDSGFDKAAEPLQARFVNGALHRGASVDIPESDD